MKVLISEQLFQVCSAAFGIDAPRWNEKWVLHYYEDPEIVALRHGEVMVISLIHVTPAVLCTPSRTIQYTPPLFPISLFISLCVHAQPLPSLPA